MANEEEAEDELSSREEGEKQAEEEEEEEVVVEGKTQIEDHAQGAARLAPAMRQQQQRHDYHADTSERRQKSRVEEATSGQNQKESRSPLFVPIGFACKQERTEDGTCLSWRLESLSWALIEGAGEIERNFTCLIGGHKEDDLRATDCCPAAVATLAGAIRQLEESIGGRDCQLVCWGPQALRQHLHPAAKRAKLELPKMFDEYVDLSKLEPPSGWLGGFSSPGAPALAPPSPSPSSSSSSAAAAAATGSGPSSSPPPPPSPPPSSGSGSEAVAAAGAATVQMQMQMLDRPAPCLCCHQYYLPAATYLEPAHLHQVQQQQQVAENGLRQQVWQNEEMLKLLSCAESNCEPQTTERLVEIMSELLVGLLADGHQFKRIERIKRRVEVGLCKPGGPLEQRVVRARGLPWQATEQDIADFFAGLNIARGGVGLCLSRQGRRNGEALIQFESREQRNLALLRHKHFMGARYIEVYRASADDFLSVAAGYNNRAQAFLSRGAQVIVRMRGLPFTCSARQILDFFHDCQLLGGQSAPEDSILFVKNLDDKPTGDAFVLFSSEQQAQRALQKHKQNIGTRYVELFRSTISEVQQVLSISAPAAQEATSLSLSSSPPLSCSSASSPPTSSSSSSPAATATLVDSSPQRHQQATVAKASPVTYAQAAGQQQQQQQEAAKRAPSPGGKLALALPRPPPVSAGADAAPPPAESEGQRGKSCEQPPPQSPLSSLSGGSSIAGSSSQRSSAASGSGSGADRRRNQQYHHPNYHHFQQQQQQQLQHQHHHHHQQQHQQQQQLSSVYAGRQHHYAAHMHHPAAYWAPQPPHPGHRQHQHHYQPHLAQAAAYHHHHHHHQHQYGAAAHPQSYPNYQYYPAAGAAAAAAPPPPQYCAMAAGPPAAIEHHQHVRAAGSKRDCVRLRGLPFEAQVEDVLYFLGERSKEILFQGVHMVYSAQGQPSGEAIIQMSSPSSAAQVAQEFHKKVMSVGKKQRYIEVLPCSIDDINLAATTPAGGLLLPRAPLPLARAPVAAASQEVQTGALAAAPAGQSEPVGGAGEHQAGAANANQQQQQPPPPPPAKPTMAVPNLVPSSPLAAAAAAAAATAAAAYYPVLYYYPPPPPQAMGQQQQVHHLPAAAPYHC